MRCLCYYTIILLYLILYSPLLFCSLLSFPSLPFLSSPLSSPSYSVLPLLFSSSLLIYSSPLIYKRNTSVYNNPSLRNPHPNHPPLLLSLSKSSIYLLLPPSVLYLPLPLPSPQSSHPLIQSIRVGIWIYLLIFYQYPTIPTIRPRTN